MNKFFIFILFFLCITKIIDAQSYTYFVTPNPIENYNPQGCGLSPDAACITINDAIYSFLNQTSPDSTKNNLVINLISGTYFGNINAPGVNDTIDVSELNVVIQGYDLTTKSNTGQSAIIHGTYLSKYSLFTIAPKANITTLNFNNIQFEYFVNRILYTTIDGMLIMSINNCTITNSTTSATCLINTTSRQQLSSISLINSTVTHNNNTYIISLYRSNINITNCVFDSNNGVYVINFFASGAYIVNSVLSNNIVGSKEPLFNGGNSIVYIDNSIVKGNRGAQYVFNFIGTSVNIKNCTFYKNNDPINSHYGALYLSGCTTIIANSTFTLNNAQIGGAIYDIYGSLEIRNSTFDNNQAKYASQIYKNRNSLYVYDSKITQSMSLNVLPQSLVGVTSTNAFFNNTQIQVTSTIATTFAVIDCDQAFISFTDASTIQTINQYNNLTCTQCTTFNQRSSLNPPLICPPSSSSSESPSSEKHSSSSSSDNGKDYHAPSGLRLRYIVLITLFSFLLFFGLVTILACVLKQRKAAKLHTGYKEIAH
ncbi:hypothetical protein CYY_002552 [Polysphondylium violaceum]|uniref:Right handed beta helix domain-containing protein n=1 Tax=Polysphondylium violaceum TaxID=133409 RepID=A0A8J4PZ63_9MYCE|nr:hypothetical protein CYY_002552 [Polysphondylium violaceum]